MPLRRTLLCCTAPIALLPCTLALAGTIRHDVDANVHVNYGDGIRMVGGVSAGLTGFGTGVLINREWVLTAAHVVAGLSADDTISFETDHDPSEVAPDGLYLSGFFYVDKYAIHEFYDDVLGPAGGFDIALLHLETPIPQYQPYNRFRANPATNPEIGRIGTAVGFGATGTGIAGYDVNTAGFTRLAGDNTIDAIANHPRVIDQFVARDVVDPQTGQALHFTQDQIASQFMLSDFDGPATDAQWTNTGLNPLGSPDSLALEYCVAPGDSGGPLFTNLSGELQVMGINSFIHGLPTPYGDGTDNATYTDLAGYLRVSQFNGWIDGVLVPDPSGLGLIGVVGILALRRLRHGTAHRAGRSEF